MLLGGLWAIAGMAATPPNDPPVEGVIEITENGVNPAICTVQRNASIRWLNATNSTRRIVNDTGGFVDTLDFAPGAYSQSFGLTGGFNNSYHDVYDLSITGRYITVVNGPTSCTAFPPTPTPTATPIGGIPTPTPTPIVPEACIGQSGCALSPYVSRDEE